MGSHGPAHSLSLGQREQRKGCPIGPGPRSRKEARLDSKDRSSTTGGSAIKELDQDDGNGQELNGHVGTAEVTQGGLPEGSFQDGAHQSK